MESVSLIIPLCNQVDCLPVILKSVAHMNVDGYSFETVLVDDGYNSGIETELRKWPNTNIRYAKHDTNLGRSAARNTGAMEATGELLVFIDGDRFLSPNFIREHMACHKHAGEAVVIGDIVEVFLPGAGDYSECIPGMFFDHQHAVWHHARRYNYADCVFGIFGEDGTTTSPVPWITMFSGNFSIRKGLFEKVGGFDRAFQSWGFENIEFGYRLHRFGVKYLLCRNAVNFHIYHKRDRGLDGNVSASYLLSKYGGAEDLRSYMKFLQGHISLGMLEESAGATRQEEGRVIHYNSSKFGPRYRMPTVSSS